MGRLRHMLDQGCISFIPCAVAPFKRALLEEGFQVVEHQQAASLLHEGEEEAESLIDTVSRKKVVLAHQDREPVVQNVLEGGGIVQRTPEHTLEVRRHLLHESSCQSCLADAAQAQQGHQAAVVSQQPALQFG